MLMEKLKVSLGFVKGNVATIIVTNTIRGFSMSMVMPFIPLYIKALGGTAPIIGLATALSFLAGLVVAPFGGYVADYKGRAKLLVFLSFMESLSFLIFLLAEDWTTLVFGMFFRGLFMFSMSIEDVLVADSLKPEERAVGFAAVRAIPGIVAIVSPYISGVLQDLYGTRYAIRLLIAVNFALDLLSAMIRLKFLEETMKESKDVVIRENFFSLFKSSYGKVGEALRGMPESLKIIAILSFVNSLFVMMVSPFVPVYATEVIELNMSQWGFILLIIRALQILLSIPLGMVIDKFGKTKILFFTLALSPLPVLLFAFSKTFVFTLAVFLLIQFIDTINVPAFQALMADLVPKEMRGRLNTAIGSGVVFIGMTGDRPPARGFLLTIAVAVGSSVGGYVYDLHPQYPWFVFSLSLILCFLLYALYVHKPTTIRKSSNSKFKTT